MDIYNISIAISISGLKSKKFLAVPLKKNNIAPTNAPRFIDDLAFSSNLSSPTLSGGRSLRDQHVLGYI